MNEFALSFKSCLPWCKFSWFLRNAIVHGANISYINNKIITSLRVEAIQINRQYSDIPSVNVKPSTLIYMWSKIHLLTAAVVSFNVTVSAMFNCLQTLISDYGTVTRTWHHVELNGLVRSGIALWNRLDCALIVPIMHHYNNVVSRRILISKGFLVFLATV